MAQNCKCPACNPINQPNFEYVAPRKLTLKERIHKQRMENFAASDRAFEYVQANQGRYAEHRASVLAERAMAKTGFVSSIGESVTDAAHYVGGITKAVGDTVTSSVESVLKNPSVIADTVNNVASTIVDGVTYFPDVVLDEVAPSLSYGAKDRTNKRIDNALDGISEGLDQLGEDFTQHNKAFSSGDFESAGAVVGGYVSSAILPSKKIKALDVIDSTVKPKISKKEQIKINKMRGDAFELDVLKDLEKTQTGVVSQITVKTGSGTRTRVDLLGFDEKGNIKCTECKGSDRAPLTKNQKIAFPEIESTGGIVVGKGKGDFKGGTQIPPTRVNIIRPKK